MVSTVHVPILVKPIVEALEAFASRPELTRHRILAFDQDQQAVEKAQVRFKVEVEQGRLEIHHRRFAETEDLIESRPTLALMADLGFSSDQLEDPARGLSFQAKGPLDMRLDPSRGISCKELLNQVSEIELEKILSELGEERFSRRIAGAIISRRREGRLPGTTQELVETVVKALPPFARHGRIHVATRTFQALRIAVNEELTELDSLLDRVILKLQRGGRIAILSFHSLEDRRVKTRFKDKEIFSPLTKKPIQAEDEETSVNPRSRSAKLRIAQLI
jgi:16S rRNA (cytosine1402-N4)-methyltransferase